MTCDRVLGIECIHTTDRGRLGQYRAYGLRSLRFGMVRLEKLLVSTYDE